MNRMKAGRLLVNAAAIVAGLLFSSSCILISTTLRTGGEQRLTRAAPPPKKQGPHVIIFALDGTVPDLLMEAIRSGRAKRMQMLLGNDQGGGLFEHAYAAPNALSVLPSSTIADWSAIFTGDAPAWDGVTGDEWFVRETATFYAPVPVSLSDITDSTKTVADDLVGKELKVPTLYELLGKRTYVSMLSVHRGANYYTTVSPSSFGNLLSHLIKGTLNGEDPEKSLSSAIEEHGIPDLQVVYFPEIDIFTHAANPPFEKQLRYLQYVTDPAVGEMLDEYLKKDSFHSSYVIFIADHAQIPTLDDEGSRAGNR
jgi:Type I phosphodiesterase / nucleotide pyrophosphatase